MSWREALAANEGVLQSCDLPAATLCRLAATGKLVRLFPGTYVEPRPDARTVYAAMLRWDPKAVLLGAAAARLTFWPECPMRGIEISSARHPRRLPTGIRILERRIPHEWVSKQLTKPALTAIDLVAAEGVAGICHALRTGAAGLSQLVEALEATAGCPGQRARRSAVRAAAARPWSVPEADLHALLRRHRITGWEANFRIFAGGVAYYGDVVFPVERVILEFDGWEHHGTRRSFVADRRRQNALCLEGWLVLRFTYDDLGDPDRLIRSVRKALVGRQAA